LAVNWLAKCRLDRALGVFYALLEEICPCPPALIAPFHPPFCMQPVRKLMHVLMQLLTRLPLRVHICAALAKHQTGLA